MKKTFKKLVTAVVLTALCCTVTTPATAGAAACTHKTMVLGIKPVETTTWTHDFTYYEDVDGDGIEEIVVGTCTVTATEYTYANICKCGYWEEIDVDLRFIETTHLEAGNPYHDGTY